MNNGIKHIEISSRLLPSGQIDLVADVETFDATKIRFAIETRADYKASNFLRELATWLEIKLK